MKDLSKILKNILFLLVSLAFLMLSISCKKHDSDIIGENLEWVISGVLKSPKAPPEIKDRASSAMSKWQNGILDDPFIIGGGLTRAEGYEDISLWFLAYDEDQDLLGFGIKQEYFDKDGHLKIREFECPLFIYETAYMPIQNRYISVKFITENVKPEDVEALMQLWLDYEVHYSSSKVANHLEMPFIYIYPPEPEKVKTWIWIYDKAGNRSNTIEVLNRLVEYQK